MAQDYTLYYFPSSYFSLKAYLTLVEKGVPFTARIVSLPTHEQQADWYMKMNPIGEIPLLKHGDNCIPDSEAIIDYLEKHWTEGPRLAPDVSTPQGQTVRDLRKLLHDIPIDAITYGVMAHRKFCIDEPKFPKIVSKFLMSEKAAARRLETMLNGMKAIRGKLPADKQELLSAKIESSEKRIAIVKDADAVAKVLDDLEQVFDQIDSRLAESAKNPGEDGEVWLVGNTFTAVDITASCLFLRLELLGMDRRYYTVNKRQRVAEYWTRLQGRPSVKKMLVEQNTSYYHFMRTIAWKCAKVGLVVGSIIGGVVAARYLYNSRVSKN